MRNCSLRCRVAAHRKRQQPLPVPVWLGKQPKLSARSRTFNADGTPALSNAELGEHLIEIARLADDGAPKTGRRFYYLALMEGLIRPDMGADEAASESRDAAYKRITDVAQGAAHERAAGLGGRARPHA